MLVYLYNFRAKVKASKSNVDDVAVVDEAFMTEYKDFSLQHAISNIEDQLQTDVFQDDEHDDVMPQAAQDMGSGIVWSSFTQSCLFGEAAVPWYKGGGGIVSKTKLLSVPGCPINLDNSRAKTYILACLNEGQEELLH